MKWQLGKVEDETIKAKAFSYVNEFEKKRQQIIDAIGDADRLNKMFEEIEDFFVRLTGKAATRKGGETYAGRTIVYEDCRRDMELTFGKQFFNDLTKPLTLLLTSARWFTYVAIEPFQKSIEQIYDRLVQKTGTKTIKFVYLWQYFLSIKNPLESTILPELHKRWEKIISIPEGQREIKIASDDIKKQVDQIFDAPYPGWQYGRTHSPDIMIAAENVEAINRGDYRFVLGEIHVGYNTINNWVFVSEYPSKESIRDYIDKDLPVPQVIMIPPKFYEDKTTRTNIACVPEKNYLLGTDIDFHRYGDIKVLPLAYLVAEKKNGEIFIRNLDGTFERDAISFFDIYLSSLICHLFNPFPIKRYRPRIVIDNMVVARESWQFHADEIECVNEKRNADRYLSIRRWADELGIPRFFFCKATGERKPFFVDLASPILIDIFAKVVRKTQRLKLSETEIVITEMLPRPDQTWLYDIDGNKYTSELRIVALDLRQKTNL